MWNMKVFVWDTETTWLYSKKEKDISKQPHIVQFAWILVDMNDDWSYEEIERVDIFIKPPIKIPNVTSEVHWIYDWDVMNSLSFEENALKIRDYLNTPDVVVWHNLEFDRNVIKVEFERLRLRWMPFDYTPDMEICTMNSSTNWCRLPKKSPKSKWYKRPKLQELVKRCTWKYFFWAHNALVDVEYTLKSLSTLVKEWVVELKKKRELTLF